MLDYLISDARVFDGVAVEPQQLAIGLRNDKIAYAGPPLHGPAARRSIDAGGLYLCPGFIDTHASTGLGYRFPHAGDNKLFQGVTTEIIGNCGTSPAPITPRLEPVMQQLAQEIGFNFDWRSLSQWMSGIEAYGLPLNVGTHVGHSTVRGGVCGNAQPPASKDLEEMCGLVEQAMADGALGLATGLVYAPGCFADTQEIIRLARVASRHGGIYASHIRDERERLEDSVDEAIEIGRSADIPVLISHLKAGERPNWGKIPRVLKTIENARAEGVRLTFEVYPYTAASTKLRTFIPKAALRDGVAGMVEKLRSSAWRQRSANWLRERGTDFAGMVLITESVEGGRGKSIDHVAQAREQDPADMVVDLLLRDPDAWIVYHCMDEDDMDAAILWKESIICSDSWSYPVNAPQQIGHPHPRTFGAFTRFLERYSLSRPLIPFGQAVRKITSRPAHFLNLPLRGRVASGHYADLILLDPTKVRERATYTDPRQLSEGTEYVWVNGTLVLERGKLNRLASGRVLRNAHAR